MDLWKLKSYETKLFEDHDKTRTSLFVCSLCANQWIKCLLKLLELIFLVFCSPCSVPSDNDVDFWGGAGCGQCCHTKCWSAPEKAHCQRERVTNLPVTYDKEVVSSPLKQHVFSFEQLYTGLFVPLVIFDLLSISSCLKFSQPTHQTWLGSCSETWKKNTICPLMIGGRRAKIG